MTQKNALLRIIFGGIIFLFSLAFAYFTASYLAKTNALDYWFVLTISSIVYVVIGVIVSSVFPISLGFLFAADVLILHVLSQKIGVIPTVHKTALVGVVLLILYAFSWWKLEDPVLPPTP